MLARVWSTCWLVFYPQRKSSRKGKRAIEDAPAVKSPSEKTKSQQAVDSSQTDTPEADHASKANQPVEERAVTRIIRNRESAERSRQKRRDQNSLLEARIQTLKRLRKQLTEVGHRTEDPNLRPRPASPPPPPFPPLPLSPAQQPIFTSGHLLYKVVVRECNVAASRLNVTDSTLPSWGNPSPPI